MTTITLTDDEFTTLVLALHDAATEDERSAKTTDFRQASYWSNNAVLTRDLIDKLLATPGRPTVSWYDPDLGRTIER